MAEFHIRRAGASDADELSLIGCASFLETFAETLSGPDILAHCAEKLAASVFRRLIEQDGACAWLVEHSATGAPLGYALVIQPDLPVETGERDLELRRIYFLSRCQGTGVAAALLDEIAGEAHRAGASRLLLGVYAGNARAAAFYIKHGFRRIGERAYQIGGNSYDDHVYALDLGDDALA